MEFIAQANCDVWLLTEVPYTFSMEPGQWRFSGLMGGPDKVFAAVWAKAGLEHLGREHETAAFATVNGVRVCSCVLPWRAASSQSWPDKGDLATITHTAVDSLRTRLVHGAGELVWGGDWNQELEGPLRVGTKEGRRAVSALITELDSQTPTSGLDHVTGDRSIDHIAIPRSWTVGKHEQLPAVADDGTRLSDHDAYIVEVGV